MVSVRIPGTSRTTINLCEANAKLNHTASYQALYPVALGFFLVEPVHRFSSLGLLREIHCLRGLRLHAVCHFESIDAGLQFVNEANKRSYKTVFSSSFPNQTGPS